MYMRMFHRNIRKGIAMLPKEPNMLLSMVNMKLRDRYGSLEDLCEDMDEDIVTIEEILDRAGYRYDEATNQFKGK